MQLEHIALAIKDTSEITLFYEQLLGMSKVKSFILEKFLSNKIFGIPAETTVYQLKNGELLLEIFVDPIKKMKGYNHICIKVNQRESFIQRAIASNYECTRIERTGADLVFIKDKSGNIFEIKNND